MHCIFFAFSQITALSIVILLRHTLKSLFLPVSRNVFLLFSDNSKKVFVGRNCLGKFHLMEDGVIELYRK